MFIRGLGTAVPSARYSQQECWDALRKERQFENLTPRAQAILRKVLSARNGIETRHLALEQLSDAFEINPDVLHARFARHAPQLAAAAGAKACASAGISVTEVEAVLVSTCTGYLCPGLTSYVSEMLKLPPATLGLDLVGQGCVAALPNLATAKAFVESGRRNVLSICVEVCSAAFYLDDDPGVLISACLFGDGAAAAVLGKEPGPKKPARVVACGSTLATDHRDLLKFEQRKGMLRNVLSPKVPTLAAGHVSRLVSRMLGEQGLAREQVKGWVLHPGGRDVLAAICEQLGLKEADVEASAVILRGFGNLSSPSVYFVLDRALSDSVPNGYWFMASFGAGFACHGALLEVG